ncbi:hypothetical protein KIPB_011187 [Kipferlia bialata]|uniref:Uncharacterized protein n=1 Tax=Kipferlia bialata TaxID=797122 RepID=A0A391NQ31_9EUKA|nr:hypothetical protein KIPB_011187 [Kipferlia bialata]|eukprot:g11187.t1
MGLGAEPGVNGEGVGGICAPQATVYSPDPAVVKPREYRPRHRLREGEVKELRNKSQLSENEEMSLVPYPVFSPINAKA